MKESLITKTPPSQYEGVPNVDNPFQRMILKVAEQQLSLKEGKSTIKLEIEVYTAIV